MLDLKEIFVPSPNLSSLPGRPLWPDIADLVRDPSE